MTLVNAEYFARLREQVEAVPDCSDLQALADQALEPLYKTLEEILAQQAKLALLLALLDPPTLEEIVTWVTDFITNFLTPYVQPYYEYAAQLVLIQAEVAALIAAIEAKRESLTSCTIVLPTPPVIP